MGEGWGRNQPLEGKGSGLHCLGLGLSGLSLVTGEKSGWGRGPCEFSPSRPYSLGHAEDQGSHGGTWCCS